MSNTDSP